MVKFPKLHIQMLQDLMIKYNTLRLQKNAFIVEENKKYNCSETPAFKSKRVGYMSNQKLLHHFQRFQQKSSQIVN